MYIDAYKSMAALVLLKHNEAGWFVCMQYYTLIFWHLNAILKQHIYPYIDIERIACVLDTKERFGNQTTKQKTKQFDKSIVSEWAVIEIIFNLLWKNNG